jgi:hypothetical protein
MRRLFVPGVGLGTACCVAVYALPFVLPWVGLSGTKLDPTGRLRGWRQLAAKIDQELSHLDNPDRALIITAEGRVTASELAFYMSRQPKVYAYNDSGLVLSQYDLWGAPDDSTGRDALVITRPNRRPPSRLANAFEDVESRGEVTVPLGADRRLEFHLWHATRLKAWPGCMRR